MPTSISLTDAELVVLADTLGEHLAPLGVSSLDELPIRVRAERLHRARESLYSRGILVASAGCDEVRVPVARLLEILGRPLGHIDVYAAQGPAPWDAPTARLAAVPEAVVEQVRIEDGCTLTPYAASDTLGRLAELSGILTGFDPAPAQVRVAPRALARALAAPTPAEAAFELEQDIPDRSLRQQFSAACCDRRVAVQVRSRPQSGRRTGVELAWVSGPTGAWELPVAYSPLAHPAGADGAGDPVLLSPLGAADALHAVSDLATA